MPIAEANTRYIASCSFGKDSLATILLAIENNEPLTEAIFSEVMFSHKRGISGEMPKHIEWVYNTAIPKLESLGCNIKVLRGEKDYLDCFYRKVSRSKKKDRIGKHRGFPLAMRCLINSDVKIKPIRDYLKGIKEPIVQYVGIAIDEPKRLERMRRDGNKISLLEKYGYTERMAMELCKRYDLVSPSYETESRGGCWFCPNKRVKDFAILRKEYPHLWNELEELDKTENVVSKCFKWSVPLSEIRRRMDIYDLENELTLFKLCQ